MLQPLVFLNEINNEMYLFYAAVLYFSFEINRYCSFLNTLVCAGLIVCFSIYL